MANKKNSSHKKTTKKDKIKTSGNNTKKTSNKKDNVESKKPVNNKVENKKTEEKKNVVNKAKRELVYSSSGNDEIIKLIKLIILVTIVMVVFYFVTTVVTRKANAKKIAQKQKSEAVKIQYEDIIIGTMLNKDGEYYILIEKDNDDNLSEYETLIQTVSANEEAPTIYKANLTDIFNRIYLSDQNNFDSNLENFKVNTTALIKVSNHQISETFDNYDSIKTKLTELK